jgi:hypothetical protein
MAARVTTAQLELGMLSACCWSMLKKYALNMRLAEMLLALKKRNL